MRNAYALLGLVFLLLLGGAYFLKSEKAIAPTDVNESIGTHSINSMKFTLTSLAFKNGGTIPSQYTCDGANINPPLTIDGVPEGTVSLVLVMDDPDIPNEVKKARGIEKYDHWVVYNLMPDTKEILEGSELGSRGKNSSAEEAYTGPCPPPQYEPTEHRYIFRLYALPHELTFIAAPTLDELEIAAKADALDSAELVGVYGRRGE